MRSRGRGFAIHECAAVLAVVGIAGALLLLAGSNQRRLARLGDDVAQLRAIGQGSAQYGADNADAFWTFSWRAGQVYQSTYPDLSNAPSDLQAAANQMVYILRTRANRPDMPVLPNFIPHLFYTTLPLAEYLDQKLPWMASVSSGDTQRLKWASDPACFDLGCFSPCQPVPAGSPPNKRWPYSSSYSVPFAFFDLSPVGSRLTFSGGSTVLVFPTTVLGAQQFANVSFPSQKVLVHDRSAWHFGSRRPHCTHHEARLPLLMVDGSAPVRSAAQANPGWQPNSPTSPASTSYAYQPSCWEPAAMSPTGADQVIGRFRFTRNGVFGRDFGGPEVN